MFLISAIVVAAIPTEGLRAEEEIATQAASHTHQTTHSSSKYKVTIPKDASEKASLLSGSSTIPTMDTLIPVVDRNATIYTTETNTDGTSYQFAYVNYKNSWCAVLLGYNKNTTLTGNVLDIPDMVNAYIQPTGNLGTGNGYVAANRLGNPLYYEAVTPHIRMVDDTSQPILGMMESLRQKTLLQANCYMYRWKKPIIPVRSSPAMQQIMHGKTWMF